MYRFYDNSDILYSYFPKKWVKEKSLGCFRRITANVIVTQGQNFPNFILMRAVIGAKTFVAINLVFSQFFSSSKAKTSIGNNNSSYLMFLSYNIHALTRFFA